MVFDCFVPRSEKWLPGLPCNQSRCPRKKLKSLNDVRMDVAHRCGNAVWVLGPFLGRYRNCVLAELVNKVPPYSVRCIAIAYWLNSSIRCHTTRHQ